MDGVSFFLACKPSPVVGITYDWGLSEWTTLTAPPPLPQFGPLVKAYFLVHVRSLHLSTIPLFLSLIFRLCWLWRNRELVWDIVHGKFAKQLLSVFFLPDEVISYVYKGQRICSVKRENENELILSWFCPREHTTSWGGSGGIVIGAFRSIFLPTILMLNKQIF